MQYCYIQQHGWTLKISGQTSATKNHIVRFNLYEMYTIGKSIEIKKNRLVVANGWAGMGRMELGHC